MSSSPPASFRASTGWTSTHQVHPIRQDNAMDPLGSGIMDLVWNSTRLNQVRKSDDGTADDTADDVTDDDTANVKSRGA